jgi:protein farnesyltransferase subunit beta
MAPTHSVHWRVYASLANLKLQFSSKTADLLIDPLGVNDSRCIDVPLLLSWLSARQNAPEGGFAGRTNKLVDGCYSHWVGSCWPLIQSALDGTQTAASYKESAVGNLYSREGLTRYILGCCQATNGGLRDKPGK